MTIHPLFAPSFTLPPWLSIISLFLPSLFLLVYFLSHALVWFFPFSSFYHHVNESVFIIVISFFLSFIDNNIIFTNSFSSSSSTPNKKVYLTSIANNFIFTSSFSSSSSARTSNFLYLSSPYFCHYHHQKQVLYLVHPLSHKLEISVF